jgi:threonine dehydrogenase-like Zn-dependent dehydrogenase
MVNEPGSIRMARFRPGADRRGGPVTAGEPAVACTGAPPAIEAAVDLVGSGALWAELLLTHPLPLAELPAALPRMRSGTGLKVQVLPH